MASRPFCRASATASAMASRDRGLLKTQFKEIETDGCAEGIKKRAEWPPVISEKDLPGLEVRNGALNGSADGTDLVVVLVFAHVEFTILWLLDRRDVARPLKSLVGDNGSGEIENLLHIAFQLLHVVVASRSRVRDEYNVREFDADNPVSYTHLTLPTIYSV